MRCVRFHEGVVIIIVIITITTIITIIIIIIIITIIITIIIMGDYKLFGLCSKVSVSKLTPAAR